MTDQDRQELARRRAELAAIDAQLQALTAKGEFLRMVVRGLEGLEELAASPTPATTSVGPAHMTDAAPAPNGGAPASGKTMFAKQAVMRLQRETQRPWRTAEMAREIESRGWVINSTRPVEAIRTATIRLLQKGQLVRLDNGAYALPSLAAANGGVEGGEDDN